MPTLRRSYRIGTAGVAGHRAQGIVPPFAIGVANGVNGRQIEHVEAERRDVRQARDAIVEGAVLSRNTTLAPWHHLIPGASLRQRPFHHEGKRIASGQIRASALTATNSDESNVAKSPLPYKRLASDPPS